MSFRVETADAGTTVHLSGEIDLERSPEVRQLLLKAIEGDQSVYVHMSDVSYIDSSGIASLIEAFQAARSRGTEFELIQVSEPVRKVLQLARLDQVFTLR